MSVLLPFLASGCCTSALGGAIPTTLYQRNESGISYVSIILPKAIQKIESCTLSMSLTIQMGPSGPQNIASDSTVPIYAGFVLWVVDSASEYFGKWRIDLTEANVVADTSGTARPDLAYNGLDPMLQQACPFVSSEWFYWQIKDFKFKNRKVYRESDLRILNDASELLQTPFYINFGFGFISYDTRKLLGAGVSNGNIAEIWGIVTFTCSGIAIYGA